MLRNLALFGLTAAALVAVARPAAATQDFRAPTNLRVHLIENRGTAEAPSYKVSLRWDGPTRPDCPGLFAAANLEVRDVDLGGDFRSVQTHGDSAALFAADYANGAFFFVRNAAGTAVPLREDGNYEVRVTYEYAVSKPNVPEDIHVFLAAPILAVQVAVVPSEDPGAPQNVLALADPKSPRVFVSWESDAPRGTRFTVQRRRSGDPAKGPKADGVFETIAEGLEAARHLDRSVLPDDEYEYRVAIQTDQGLAAFSKPDTAFTQGRCPASSFRLWDGAWRLGEGEPLYSMHTVFSDADGAFAALLASPVCDPLGCAGSDVMASGRGPARLHALPRLRVPLVAKLTIPIQPFGVPEGGEADLFATMEPGDPYTTRWLLAEMRIVARSSATPMSGTLPGRLGSDTLRDTTVCGTIGAGLKPTRVLHPGDPVVIAYRIGALGPAPLYGSQLRVACTLEGGVFETVADAVGLREAAGEPPIAGRSTALFEVGALGPIRHGKSEVAKLALLAVADGTKPAMRCTIRLVDVPGDQVVKALVETREVGFAVRPPAAK